MEQGKGSGAALLEGLEGVRDYGMPEGYEVHICDQLAYMADMLRELREMAEAGGLPALSGFIEAARTEALRQLRSA